MKNVVFVLPGMPCGGLEKSLLALIAALPEDEYRIKVYFIDAKGAFLPMLPAKNFGGELKMSPRVREDLGRGGIRATLKYHLRHGHFGKVFLLAWKIMRNDPAAVLTIPFKRLEELPGQYDIAVCYHMHISFLVRYVSEKVNAKQKIAWIHNDFTASGFRLKPLIPWLAPYDHFFAVSEQLYEQFTQLAPQFREKTSVAHNIVSERAIRNALDGGEAPEYRKDGTLKILTVGRLSPEKGYDLAIRVCERLKKRGYRFQWFAMGSGKEEDTLRKMIAERGLEEVFVMLGTRLNPYPYIDRCDIYVQPSRHEGYGIAVAEARVLYKPIICTDFAGAREQIVDHKTGTIVPFEEKALTEAVAELLGDPQLRRLYSENLKKAPHDRAEIEHVMRILGTESRTHAVV